MDRADDHSENGYPPREEWLFNAPRNRPDRWAHRRGEPRGFALIWSSYLLIACILALFTPASRWSFDQQQIRASCTLLLALILVGVSVAWPMIRLSQIPARTPSRAASVDLLIVVAPLLAILAPMGFLTKWSHGTAFALVAVAVSWSLLFGGLVALFARTESATRRALAMLVCLVFAGAAPLVGLLLTSGGVAGDAATVHRASLLAAPVSAPFAITSFPSLRAPAPDALAWDLALAPLLAAAPAWLLAVTLDLLRRPATRPRAGRPG